MTKQQEEYIANILEILKNGKPTFKTSNAVQKHLKDIFNELMKQVVPIRCPQCEARNGRIRKEGATKFFRLQLSEKDQKADEAVHGTGDRAPLQYDELDKSTTAYFSDDEEENVTEEQKKSQVYLHPLEVKQRMKQLWEKDQELLNLIFGKVDETGLITNTGQGFDMFFMNTLLVTPNRFRPETSGGKGASDDRAFLHAHSVAIGRIISAKDRVGDALKQDKSKKEQEEVQDETNARNVVVQSWIELQDAVNCYLDSSLAAKTADQEKPGVRQLLERKEGIFRMKMMGKRVNYAGRSVISPDPNITTD